MNNYFKLITVAVTVIVICSGCGQTAPITSVRLNDILSKPFTSWTTEECDNIIKLSTLSNSTGMNADEFYDDVYIKATKIDVISIPALVRKEAILQRMSKRDFINRLKFYLEEFTNYTYDTSLAIITDKALTGNPLKGWAFQITFENVSNPYRMIDLEEGYAYFFLENNEGAFARVVEVSGDFADNHFYLGDYLRVFVIFSRTMDDGTLLFPNEKYIKDYKLIFNGLQDTPIVLEN
jgi:hypothetical protein